MVNTSQTSPLINASKKMDINSKEPIKSIAENISPVSYVNSKTTEFHSAAIKNYRIIKYAPVNDLKSAYLQFPH